MQLNQFLKVEYLYLFYPQNNLIRNPEHDFDFSIHGKFDFITSFQCCT